MISMQNTNYPSYVFATVNHGMTKNVVDELKNNPNIDLIAPVTGRFDLALRLKQNTPEQIVQLVSKIRQVKGIETTQTLFGFNGINGAHFQNQMPLGISLFNVTSPIETFVNQLKSFPVSSKTNLPFFVSLTRRILRQRSPSDEPCLKLSLSIIRLEPARAV